MMRNTSLLVYVAQISCIGNCLLLFGVNMTCTYTDYVIVFPVCEASLPAQFYS